MRKRMREKAKDAWALVFLWWWRLHGFRIVAPKNRWFARQLANAIVRMTGKGKVRR
jgi:hypothetical protein